MKNLVIVGAGGFGREVLWLIKNINKEQPLWNFLGFIDDATNKMLNGNKKIIGNIEYLLNYMEYIDVVVAIGNPSVRKNIVQKLKHNKCLSFPNIISPEIDFDESNNIGVGNIICKGTILTCDVCIGNFNIVNLNCTIGHDDNIKDYVTIYPNSNISGNVLLDSFVEVGTGTQIIQGKNINKHSILGAGSVVVSDIEGYCTAVGIPAKVIKRREINDED